MSYDDTLSIYDYIKFIIIMFSYIAITIITTMNLKRFITTLFNIIVYVIRDVSTVVIKNLIPYIITNYV